MYPSKILRVEFRKKKGHLKRFLFGFVFVFAFVLLFSLSKYIFQEMKFIFRKSLVDG